MIVLPEVNLDDVCYVSATYKTINKLLYECVYEYRVHINRSFLCYHRTLQYVNRSDMWNDINDTLQYFSDGAHIEVIKAE